MRQVYLILLTILSVSSASFALDKGEKSPVIKLQSTAGSETSNSQFAGQVLYIDFWASWCGPCKKSLPWMNNLQKEFENQDFKILAINLDTSRKDAERLLGSDTSNLEVLLDPEGKSPEAFGVRTMPSSFLIDRKGNIAAVYEGFHDDDAEKIHADIVGLLNEK